MNHLAICAFCQNENFSELTDINQKIPSEQNIAEKLQIINPEIVFTDDGITNYLCTKCVAKLNDYYNCRVKWAEQSKRHNFYKSKILANSAIPILIADDEIKVEEQPLDKDTKDELILQRVLDVETVLSITNQMQFPCYWCAAILPDEASLTHHLAIHPEINNKRAKTVTTHKKSIVRSKTVGTVRRRQKKDNNCLFCQESNCNHSDSDRICKHCKLIFKTAEELNEHVNCPLRLKCPHCPKKFLAKSKLDRHINIHTKKYKCTPCKKQFATQLALKTHAKTHAFKCEDCDKTFRLKRYLNKHKKIHASKKTQ